MDDNNYCIEKYKVCLIKNIEQSIDIVQHLSDSRYIELQKCLEKTNIHNKLKEYENLLKNQWKCIGYEKYVDTCLSIQQVTKNSEQISHILMQIHEQRELLDKKMCFCCSTPTFGYLLDILEESLCTFGGQIIIFKEIILNTPCQNKKIQTKNRVNEDNICTDNQSDIKKDNQSDIKKEDNISAKKGPVENNVQKTVKTNINSQSNKRGSGSVKSKAAFFESSQNNENKANFLPKDISKKQELPKQTSKFWKKKHISEEKEALLNKELNTKKDLTKENQKKYNPKKQKEEIMINEIEPDQFQEVLEEEKVALLNKDVNNSKQKEETFINKSETFEPDQLQEELPNKINESNISQLEEEILLEKEKDKKDILYNDIFEELPNHSKEKNSIISEPEKVVNIEFEEIKEKENQNYRFDIKERSIDVNDVYSKSFDIPEGILDNKAINENENNIKLFYDNSTQAQVEKMKKQNFISEDIPRKKDKQEIEQLIVEAELSTDEAEKKSRETKNSIIMSQKVFESSQEKKSNPLGENEDCINKSIDNSFQINEDYVDSEF